MKKITEFIFGVPARREKTSLHTPKFRSSFPKEKLSFEEWCKEFRVSCLHGKNVVYMN